METASQRRDHRARDTQKERKREEPQQGNPPRHTQSQGPSEGPSVALRPQRGEGEATQEETGAEGQQGITEEPFAFATVGDVASMQDFLRRGGAVDTADHWRETMMHKAALNAQAEAVSMLLDGGAQVNKLNECLQTPLHYACIGGSVAVVRLLIRRGGDLNAVDKCQQTPLHCAAIYGHTLVAEALVGGGAQLDPVDRHGMTPLHYSCANGHLDVVKFLAGAGADKDAVDQNGKTPLHTACYWGEVPIVHALVVGGARTDIADSSGRTPLQLLDRDTLGELKAYDSAGGEAGSAAARYAGSRHGGSGGSTTEPSEGTTVNAGATATDAGGRLMDAVGIAVAGAAAANAESFEQEGQLADMERHEHISTLERLVERQQQDLDVLRLKSLHDHARLTQQQEHQGWVLEQEMNHRERQGQQLDLVSSHVARFEGILRRTALVHKEVADQQNRAIRQLQAALRAKEAQLERERQDDRGAIESFAKASHDAAARLDLARAEQQSQIDAIAVRLTSKDDAFARQQQVIDKILADADSMRQQQSRAAAAVAAGAAASHGGASSTEGGTSPTGRGKGQQQEMIDKLLADESRHKECIDKLLQDAAEMRDREEERMQVQAERDAATAKTEAQQREIIDKILADNAMLRDLQSATSTVAQLQVARFVASQAEQKERIDKLVSDATVSNVRPAAAAAAAEEPNAILKQQLEAARGQTAAQEAETQSIRAKVDALMQERESLVQRHDESIRVLHAKIAADAVEYEKRHKASHDEHVEGLRQLREQMAQRDAEQKQSLVGMSARYREAFNKMQTDASAMEEKMTHQRAYIERLVRDTMAKAPPATGGEMAELDEHDAAVEAQSRVVRALLLPGNVLEEERAAAVAMVKPEQMAPVAKALNAVALVAASAELRLNAAAAAAAISRVAPVPALGPASADRLARQLVPFTAGIYAADNPRDLETRVMSAARQALQMANANGDGAVLAELAQDHTELAGAFKQAVAAERSFENMGEEKKKAEAAAAAAQVGTKRARSESAESKKEEGGSSSGTVGAEQQEKGDDERGGSGAEGAKRRRGERATGDGTEVVD